jgi:cation transport regulator ChaC
VFTAARQCLSAGQLLTTMTMTEQLVTQHYVPEWHTDEGVRIVVARVYVGSKRTSAYVPMPQGEHPEGIPVEVYMQAQELYDIDNQKQF